MLRDVLVTWIKRLVFSFQIRFEYDYYTVLPVECALLLMAIQNAYMVGNIHILS